MNCFAGEGHVVDEDTFPQYLNTIRPVIKKALTLAALTSGFQTILTFARRQSPIVKIPSIPAPVSKDATVADEVVVSVTRETTPPPPEPSRLATIEERLLRLQVIFTQLAPDLLSTTTGLYQLKDSVGQIKRRLRARQARHRSQSKYQDSLQE